MSDVRKFKFISPGIFLREIDNSGLPAASTAIGPVIIGRANQGPSMRPYTVQSFSEFVNVFGEPVAGGVGGDYFREGNTSAPTYGAYAAQAYLDAGVGPVTYIRMLGNEHPEKDTGGEAGFSTLMDFQSTKAATLSDDIAENGGSYGLFVFPSGGVGDLGTGSLAAIFYVNSGSAIQLTGSGRTDGMIILLHPARLLSSSLIALLSLPLKFSTAPQLPSPKPLSTLISIVINTSEKCLTLTLRL